MSSMRIISSGSIGRAGQWSIIRRQLLVRIFPRVENRIDAAQGVIGWDVAVETGIRRRAAPTRPARPIIQPSSHSSVPDLIESRPETASQTKLFFNGIPLISSHAPAKAERRRIRVGCPHSSAVGCRKLGF